jgi:CspA family cold shock protein
MTRKEKRRNKMSINGKVKWFNATKGFGFIAREDNEKDVFVHTSAVKEANLELNEGDAITFDITETPKGNSAINLRK